jgi:hypothetical protein
LTRQNPEKQGSMPVCADNIVGKEKKRWGKVCADYASTFARMADPPTMKNNGFRRQ